MRRASHGLRRASRRLSSTSLHLGMVASSTSHRIWCAKSTECRSVTSTCLHPPFGSQIMNRFRVPFRWYVIACHPSGGSLDGRTHLPSQLPGGLVETHYRTLRIVLRLVQVQHVLHPRHELPAHLGDTPLFLLPGLEFVFLSIWRTVSREMLSANSNSTTWSANNWSVQCVCPSGAALHAKAIAVQLALLARPRSVIDGGLKSFLHVPLPRSGDRGGVDQQHIGYLIPKPLVSLEQRQRTLHGAH